MNIDEPFWINNEIIHRYFTIKFYFSLCKKGDLEKTKFNELKRLLLSFDFWECSIEKLSEKKLSRLVVDALVMIADLYDEGALTIDEFNNELRKVRTKK